MVTYGDIIKCQVAVPCRIVVPCHVAVPWYCGAHLGSRSSSFLNNGIVEVAQGYSKVG